MTRNLTRAASVALAAGLALILSSCFVLVDGVDIEFGPYYDHDLNSSTPTVPFAAEIEMSGRTRIMDDTQETCIDALNEDSDPDTVGGWGDVGSSTHTTTGGNVVLTSLGTPPTEDTVNCMLAEITDDPNVQNDNESLVCDDGATQPDCQVPDGGGQGTYVVDTERTDWMQAAFNTYGEVELLLTILRDTYVDDSYAGNGSAPDVDCQPAGVRCIDDPNQSGTSVTDVKCIVIRQDSTWTTATGGTVQWRATCLS